MARFLVLALLLVCPPIASEGIYRTTDKDGNVIFTDAPAAGSSGSEKVGLQPTNRAPPPPDVPAYERDDEKPEPAEEPEYEVVIVKPLDETTIPMGPGNFSVSARLNPSLKKYDSLQLLMDGEPRGEPQASAYWDLTNVFRGAHEITVRVINSEGETVGASEPVTVYVLRPSVNFKNRN